MFEWLTLWPTSGPLPVRSQRNDIGKSSQKPAVALSSAPVRPTFQEGGRIEARTGRVKPAGRAGFASDFSRNRASFTALAAYIPASAGEQTSDLIPATRCFYGGVPCKGPRRARGLPARAGPPPRTARL